MPKGGKRKVCLTWAWRLTLRARGVRVGVGLRGVGLRGLRWGLGPRRRPILWHVPGAPGAPRPASRSPASTRRGPVAPWSGRRRPTCDHQPHKTRVTDRMSQLTSFFLPICLIYITISLICYKCKDVSTSSTLLRMPLRRLKHSCLVLLMNSVEGEKEEEKRKNNKKAIDRRWQ